MVYKIILCRVYLKEKVFKLQKIKKGLGKKQPEIHCFG